MWSECAIKERVGEKTNKKQHHSYVQSEPVGLMVDNYENFGS